MLPCFCCFSSRWTHRSLLAVLAGLFLVLALASAFVLQNYHQALMNERQDRTRKMVDNAYALVAYYKKKADKGELDEAKAKHYALETIKQIMPEPNGYFWVIDTYPRGVMHPVKTPWEGVDLSDYRDLDGKKLFTEMVRIVRTQGEGFIDYAWSKPHLSGEKLYPKKSYIKLYEPWDWIIGTGVYIDDINKSFWNAVIVACGLTIAVLMFAMALAMTISESLKKE